MTITIRPRWSLGRGKTLVPSRWQATRAPPATTGLAPSLLSVAMPKSPLMAS